MRSGELAVPDGSHFNPTIHLAPKDITADNLQNPTTLKIMLKVCKTDQTLQGIDLFIGRTWNSLCPVVAMLRYLAIRGIDEGPLFRYSNGLPLSRISLVTRVRRALQQAGIN